MEGQAGQLTEVPRRRRGVTGVVDSICKELRRSTGQNIETAEITKLLRETVIQADCCP